MLQGACYLFFKVYSSPSNFRVHLKHDPGNRIFTDVIKGYQHKILLNFSCALNSMTGVLLTRGDNTESNTAKGHMESEGQRLGW